MAAVRYRVTGGVTTPESKKQAKSAVRYRVIGGVTTPEKKKQAESVVRYRVFGGVTTPESKKQAKSAVRYRVTAIAPAYEKQRRLIEVIFRCSWTATDRSDTDPR